MSAGYIPRGGKPKNPFILDLSCRYIENHGPWAPGERSRVFAYLSKEEAEEVYLLLKEYRRASGVE